MQKTLSTGSQRYEVKLIRCDNAIGSVTCRPTALVGVKMLPVILLLSLVDFAQVVLLHTPCTILIALLCQTDGGTVEIQFVRYKNWAHKVNYGAYSGYCCDSYSASVCIDECDNYFIVCLREYNPTNDNKCPQRRTTGEFGDDVAFATGSSALRNGLNNPFSLSFNGAWKVRPSINRN